MPPIIPVLTLALLLLDPLTQGPAPHTTALPASVAAPLITPADVDALLADGLPAEAAARLATHLEARPEDDVARFALGWTQVLLAMETFAAGAYAHGLELDRNLSMLLDFIGPPLPALMPSNPEPLRTSHADLRALGARWLSDLDAAIATLDAIDDPDVALTLGPARFAIRPVGDEPLRIFEVLRQDTLADEELAVRVRFDRADVHWLAGYCHALSAPMEVLLAVDNQPVFDVAGHLFVADADSPSARFNEGELDEDWSSIPDLIAAIHNARLEVIEPERMLAALAHAEGLFAESRAMWASIAAETDDELEWIPSPRQGGPLDARIDRAQLASWQALMADAEALFLGETLLPFWRGGHDGKGLNLRRIFTEPTALDPILWSQGLAALPYLEEGEITRLGAGSRWRQIERIFGGNLLGFALWVN